MRSPSSLMRAAAAATLLCASAASHAAYLDGTTVSYAYKVIYPDGYTQYQVGPVQATVDSGVEFTYGGPFSGIAELDFSDGSISFLMKSSPAFFDVPFQGMVLGLSSSLAPLKSVSFSSDTSSVFLGSGVLSFDQHTISINMRNMYFSGGERFTLNLTPAPVPEAQTYALALAGLGVVGISSLRRRAAKRALEA